MDHAEIDTDLLIPDTVGAVNQTRKKRSSTSRRPRRTLPTSKAWLFKLASRRAVPQKASWSWLSSSWPTASVTDGVLRRMLSLPSRYVKTLEISPNQHAKGTGHTASLGGRLPSILLAFWLESDVRYEFHSGRANKGEFYYECTNEYPHRQYYETAANLGDTGESKSCHGGLQFGGF